MNTPRTPSIVTWLSLSAAALAGLGGCGRSVNLKTWQNDVETYVEANGNDPAVLRDVTLTGSRRGFGAIDEDDPRRSQDANAVLVAHEVVGGRPWFIYLVGIVDELKVEEIRVAALSMLQGKPIWRIGRKDPEALKRYRDYSLAQWTQQHPGDRRPPAEFTTFPRDPDVFDATVSDMQVRVRHQGSGAQWEVNLAAKK